MLQKRTFIFVRNKLATVTLHTQIDLYIIQEEKSPDDNRVDSDEKATVTDDYDSPWKEAVEHYFPEFMEFYFPNAYAKIDWSTEPIFLDQELRAVVQDAELGKRFIDKLVSVQLINGDEKWIYIHIEVQGNRQSEFAERMFVYNYRIFDRYRRPVASMAVLADEHVNWKPTSYEFDVLGCEHTLKFPVAKLTDYYDQLDELQALENSFAIVTAAHIQTQRTRKNDSARHQAKRVLVHLLYDRKWERQKIIDLYHVIEWMMKLPKELEQQLWQEITEIEESKNMQYVSSGERIGIEKGVIQGEAEMLRVMLKYRFGDLPEATINKLKPANEDQLKKWLINAISAPTLDAVFNDDKSH